MLCGDHDKCRVSPPGLHEFVAVGGRLAVAAKALTY